MRRGFGARIELKAPMGAHQERHMACLSRQRFLRRDQPGMALVGAFHPSNKVRSQPARVVADIMAPSVTAIFVPRVAEDCRNVGTGHAAQIAQRGGQCEAGTFSYDTV